MAVDETMVNVKNDPKRRLVLSVTIPTSTPSPRGQSVQQRGFQLRTNTLRLSERREGKSKTKDRNEAGGTLTAPGYLQIYGWTECSLTDSSCQRCAVYHQRVEYGNPPAKSLKRATTKITQYERTRTLKKTRVPVVPKDLRYGNVGACPCTGQCSVALLLCVSLISLVS